MGLFCFLQVGSEAHVRGSRTNDETRAAIMAALLTGQGVSEIAAKYKVHASIVSRMKMQLPREKLQEVAIESAERFTELLSRYLAVNLKTLEAQADLAGDRKWLEKQSGDTVAVLHGVFADKAFRLFEALAAATESKSDTRE